MGILKPKLHKSKLNKSEQGEAKEKGGCQPGKRGLGTFQEEASEQLWANTFVLLSLHLITWMISKIPPYMLRISLLATSELNQKRQPRTHGKG